MVLLGLFRNNMKLDLLQFVLGVHFLRMFVTTVAVHGFRYSRSKKQNKNVLRVAWAYGPCTATGP